MLLERSHENEEVPAVPTTHQYREVRLLLHSTNLVWYAQREDPSDTMVNIHHSTSQTKKQGELKFLCGRRGFVSMAKTSIVKFLAVNMGEAGQRGFILFQWSLQTFLFFFSTNESWRLSLTFSSSSIWTNATVRHTVARSSNTQHISHKHSLVLLFPSYCGSFLVRLLPFNTLRHTLFLHDSDAPDHTTPPPHFWPDRLFTIHIYCLPTVVPYSFFT